MPLERCLTPSILTLLVRDLDKEPPRRDTEVFNVRDSRHDGRKFGKGGVIDVEGGDKQVEESGEGRAKSIEDKVDILYAR